jgi:hypothetical protein
MKQVRLFLVIAALVGLGYLAVHRGLVHDFSLVKARPSPSPTPLRHAHRWRRHRHYAGRQKSEPWASASATEKHGAGNVTVVPAVKGAGSPGGLAALHSPRPNALEIPSAGSSPKPPEVAKNGFPAQFEGCWEGTVDQPDTWEFGHGPILKGWEPATYQLCFRHSGAAPDVTFSTSSAYPVVSQWVVSNVGVENGHTQLLFSGDDFVVLRASTSTSLHMKILGFLPGPTGEISSKTDFHCTLLPNGKLRVEASVVQRCSGARSIDCDGDVWVTESWHTEFSRQSS